MPKKKGGPQNGTQDPKYGSDEGAVGANAELDPLEAADDGEDDGGGLMGAISKAGKKKAKREEVDFEGKDAVEATGDDFWAEEETSRKKKGGKKGGKKGPRDDDAADDADAGAGADELDDNLGDGDNDEPDEKDSPAETRVLSKKEKEKLKKEKEKARKKASAQAKKTTTANKEPSKESADADAEGADAAAKDNEEGDEPKSSAAAAKRKKKKAAAGAESTETPKEDSSAATAAASAGKGKKAPPVAALRAMMEQRKAAEEEAKRKAEEEERQIREEEKRQAEEAKTQEEARAKKREKEKAKKAQLKKDGKLLTTKQKQEQAAAKARLQALIDSGVKVEGLQQNQSDQPQQKKKVSYGKGKSIPKGKPVQQQEKQREQQPATAPEEEEAGHTETISQKIPEPEQEPKIEQQHEKEEITKDEVKDDWDAESEHESDKAAEADDIKDDWDAESEEEQERQPAPVVETKEVKKTPELKAPGKAEEAAASVAPQKISEKDKEEREGDEEEEEDEEAESEEEESESDSKGGSSDESSDEEESDEERISSAKRITAQRKAEAAERRAKKHEEALAMRSKDDMRSPICCILGHVDTGKTKLLDKIRQTNVQEGEAGGITQQIGATFFPMENIRKKTSVLGEHDLKEYKLPGLLVIDTPGHESFTNLRTRGSSLCNIAVLVVDIMHGLEPQTLESLRLLRDKKTPFIVALNKIDRLYSWESHPNMGFRESFSKQNRAVQSEYESRLKSTIVAFAEQGLNAVPYYENTNFARNVSLVPTSAVTGEGVPDMLMLLIKLTQERMSERLMYLAELECTVLEVKVIEGLGTTIDVVLSNGVMKEGDKIVVCGLNGAIVTQVRALLTPQPLKELRIKSQYVHHKEVKASLGIKIVAPELEKAIAGSRLLLVGEDDDEDELREEVMSDLASLLESVDKTGRGVWVQASTLGSLEALLEFLRTSKIPVSGINIGPVHKKDVVRAAAMLERAPEVAVMLCFDVVVEKDAERLANEVGLKIFQANIIYHLFDEFTKHNQEIMEAKQRDSAPKAVWPVRLKTIACFAKRDPIILGCDIVEGSLRVGTPLAAIKTDPETKKKETVPLGKVTSLEINHRPMNLVKKSQSGGGVAVKIEHAVYEASRLFGRHFDEKDEIVSLITRESLDIIKTTFREQVTKEDIALLSKLKTTLGVL